MSRGKQRSDIKFIYLFWAVFAIGIAARVWRFGTVPGGLNQDEAFAGYEAWSLLHYGIDTAGYRFPVYLTAWGSGMNALNTYLMMPFIAVFGLKVWVMRLPQLIAACLTLPAVYGIVRSFSERKNALFVMFMLAVCPWHILLSRWGLESNLAPGFLTFGLYFFIRGLDDPKYLLLSACMYGLSLYAYATIWPFVPLMILLQIVYCARCGRLQSHVYSVVSLVVLGLFALPLLLFLAVNFGLIDEIRLPFLSVPRLLYMRSGEISFSNIPENCKKLFSILIRQSDGLIWNSPSVYGQTYRLSRLFQPIGIIVCCVLFIKSLRNRQYIGETLLLIQLFAGLLLGLLIDVNVNRVNILFIPLVFFGSYGMIFTAEHIDKRLLYGFVIVYLCLFFSFENYYFNDYKDRISYAFNEGVGEAVEAASEKGGTVYISDDVLYPVVLFYSQTPVDEFRSNVQYISYPAAYLRAKKFGRYMFFGDGDEPQLKGVYVLGPYDDPSRFEDAGYRLTQYGVMTLAEP